MGGHDDTQAATKGLVFMLAGVTTKWKQAVCYYLASDSTDGSAYVPIVKKIIEEAKKVGLTVRSVVSDMGAPNVKM